jgi:hypothetical protein
LRGAAAFTMATRSYSGIGAARTVEQPFLTFFFASGRRGTARERAARTWSNASWRAMGDRWPLGSRFQDCCRTTREGGGLPEGPGIPAGITHDLVLQFDLPARRMEREERLLAMHGGDVNETLRDICVEGGGMNARFLLAHGADANFLRGEDDVPVLLWAAAYGHLSVVEALLDAGAGQLEWALVWAVGEGGPTDVAALLLDRGANVHFEDDWALKVAAGGGFLDSARLLLQRGANVTDRILADAVEYGGEAMADLLRAHLAL